MTVSDRIKLIRTSQPGGKMSRAAFGEKMGISGAMVQNIEEAEVRLKGGIPDSTLKLICATYQVNYQWLTEGKEPMYLRDEGEELIARYAPDAMEHMKKAIRIMSELPDADWLALRDFLDDLTRAVEGMRSDPPEEG